MSTLPDDQHMARVNLAEGRWHEFRELARSRRQTVAAYLGHLVEMELGRAARGEARRAARWRLEAQAPPERENAEPAGESDNVDGYDGWVPPWEE